MQDFKNILSFFRTHINDLTWCTRPIDFTKSYQNKLKVSPSQLKHLVYTDIQLLKALKEISEHNKSGVLSKKLVLETLTEIGYAYDLAVIRWLGYLLVKILRKSLSALYVNEEKLLRIKNEMGDSPVIFVPTHRSYGDFILMAFICFYYEINIPCVAAGMDFHSMQFVNEILRRSKAFYMRRKFSDDPIYRTIFREYMKALITYEDSPIEFFIEGTRSRSGKTLMPKFGLLTMFIEAFLLGNVPDIKIVPVNISYDRILEETLFAHEMLGIPKPKESTKGLLKALKNMNGNYGRIFINFGDPFSVRTLLFEDDPRFRSTEKVTTDIKEVAFQIIKLQQRLQTFGCFNILSLIIYNSIINTNSNCIALHDAIEDFKWMLGIFQIFDANVCIEGNTEDAIRESVNVHSSLVELSHDNYIHLKINSKLVGKTENGHLSGVPFIMLQIYVNPSVNLFIRSSIIIAVLKRIGKENELPEGILHENYRYLCDILRYEFPFNNRDSYKEFHYSLSRLNALNVIEINNSVMRLKQNNNTIDFLYNLIHPFLVGIYSVCSFLNKFQKEVLQKPKTDVIKMVQVYVKGTLRESLFATPIYQYCLSTDLISNSIDSLSSMNIIDHNAENNKYTIDALSLDKATNYLRNFLIKEEHISKKNTFNQTRSDIMAKL